jgi:hypothetical protein
MTRFFIVMATKTGAPVKSAIATMLMLILCTAHAQAQKDSALVYETTTRTSTAFGAGGDAVARTRTTESTLGIREELLESTGSRIPIASSPFLKPGSYRLTLANGEFYVIDPVAREYFSLIPSSSDTADMMSTVKDFSQKVSGNSTSEADSVGDGDVIAGEPTTHWKIHEVMRMSTKVDGDSVITGEDMTTDAYYAKSVAHISRLDLPEFQRDGNAKQKLPGTLVLRSLMKGTMSVPGMAIPIEISREVTSIGKHSLDASLFAIPKDFTKVDMPFPKASDLLSH